jgi:predicted  nucleic acid-binding Zn-ribbon protein
MTADTDRDTLRQELRALDERLAKLRAELEGLREEMRDYDDSPTATGLLLEQEALIEALEGRRAELLEQLGED